MSERNRKYPGWLQWLLKLIIIVAAIIVISSRFSPEAYEGIFSYSWTRPSLFLPLFAGLWILNLLLDARIWQKVHNMLAGIPVLKALETNLVCYTLSFVTPVNSGELAGRYLMLEPSVDRRMTIFLTFWSHFPRLIVKLVLGATAMLVLVQNKPLNHTLSFLIWGVIIVLSLAGYLNFVRIQKWLSGLGWRRIALGNYLLSQRPRTAEKLQLLLLSATKFLTYNLQFVALLMLWGGVPFSAELLALTIMTYVLGAFIPTLPMADFLVKAGIALVVFDPGFINESLLLNAAMTTWLFNLALPSLAGGLIIIEDGFDGRPYPKATFIRIAGMTPDIQSTTAFKHQVLTTYTL